MNAWSSSFRFDAFFITRFAAGGAPVAIALAAACSSAEGEAPIYRSDAATDAQVRDTGSQSDAAAVDASSKAGCPEYAKAYCARLRTCAPGFFFPGRYLDAADCEVTNAKTCALEHAGAGVGDVSFSACVDDLSKEACADMLSRKVPDTCRGGGTLANGAACGSDLQCVSGFCPKAASGCGVCTAATSVGETA